MKPDGDDEDDDAPRGPYFGRLLVVLFAAVAFCGLLTWAISTYFEH